MTGLGWLIVAFVGALFAWVIVDTFREVGEDFERFQRSLDRPGPYDQDDEDSTVRIIRIEERGDRDGGS